MAPAVKILIGLAAVIVLGVLHHGPLGGGERFVTLLEAHAQRRIEVTELQGIRASFHGPPLSRRALMSGAADAVQRGGFGSFPGLNERIATIPGVSGVRWSDEPERWTMPLVAETLLQLVIAYFVGLGLGRLFFGRKKRQSFLD